MPVEIDNRYQPRIVKHYFDLSVFFFFFLNAAREGRELNFLLIWHRLLFCYLSNVGWMNIKLL